MAWGAVQGQGGELKIILLKIDKLSSPPTGRIIRKNFHKMKLLYLQAFLMLEA